MIVLEIDESVTARFCAWYVSLRRSK